MKIKKLLVKKIPFLLDLYNLRAKYRFDNKDLRSVFNKIYDKNIWGSTESLSGSGAELSATENIKVMIPKLLKKYKVECLLDLPCGDFNWMQHVQLDVKKYIGADIVEELIKTLKNRYENDTRSFCMLDVTKDKLPLVDLLLCRDVLVHLSYKDKFKALENIKDSKIKYLLTSSFPTVAKNRDVVSGGWRRINLQKKPYSFPDPLEIIFENEAIKTAPKYTKTLCLWKVEDL